MKSWISVNLAILMMVGSGWMGGYAAWAAPLMKRGVRVAQADTSGTAQVQKTSPPANNFPNAAWALESAGAILGAAGFIVAGLGVSFLSRRNQLVRQAEDVTRELKDIPSAKEVKSLEDTGMVMVIGGWIAAGVGLTAMLVGAVWLLAHRPTPSTLPPGGKDNPRARHTTPLSHNASTLMVLQ